MTTLNVGDSLKGFNRKITQKQVNEYADASGDHNPIHLDEDYANRTPFGTRIAHGMLTAGLVAEMLTDTFPDSWHAGGTLKIRFNAPVLPGETVTLYGEVASITEKDAERIAVCKVGCKKPNGRDAVSGQATVKLE